MVSLPVFPPVRAGDFHEAATQAGIGYVITSWEGVELQLARLFSSCMGHPDDRVVAFLGERGRIFRDRMDMVKLAVGQHFVVSPDQELEGRFDKLTESVTAFSSLRNNVGHCQVYDLSGFAHFMSLEPPPILGRPHFICVPATYAITRNYKPDSTKIEGVTPFAYSSRELLSIHELMSKLSLEVRDLRHSLFPDLWPEELRAPSNAK